MPASPKPPEVTEVVVVSSLLKQDRPRLPVFNPFATVEAMLRRDEADALFIAGNIALAAFEVIDWPVAALAIVAHAMARSRFKALQALAEVREEVG